MFMNKSIKVSSEKIKEIIDYYNAYQKECSDINKLFEAKTENVSVTIYNNNTVFFQGKDALLEASKWDTYSGYLDNHIGSDEVGCGDYLAPIVVCASYVKKEDINYLLEIGVKDSKQLNDTKIQEIFEHIKDRIAYAYFVLSNEKYNELINKGYNLNKIKAYLHNFVLYNLVKKTNFSSKIVVDDFCGESLYYRYLLSYDNSKIQKNITFETKAENKYLAVACGSIIARHYFIEEINKINARFDSNIPLGASSKVDDYAKQMVLKYGTDFLLKYSKYHFKNTEKVLGKEDDGSQGKFDF